MSAEIDAPINGAEAPAADDNLASEMPPERPDHVLGMLHTVDMPWPRVSEHTMDVDLLEPSRCLGVFVVGMPSGVIGADGKQKIAPTLRFVWLVNPHGERTSHRYMIVSIHHTQGGLKRDVIATPIGKPAAVIATVINPNTGFPLAVLEAQRRDAPPASNDLPPVSGEIESPPA